MLYTSYFAKAKNLNENFKLFSITAKKPVFFNGEHLDVVAPSEMLVFNYKKGEVDEEQYTKIYLDYLNKNKEIIISKIKQLPNNSVLLCYEGPGKFCHRHILSEWLRENNIEIIELK